MFLKNLALNLRYLVSFGALFLFASVAHGGTYQRTTDRKSYIWNNDPKPEDAATWSGERGADGYATGPGTLTWYKVNRKLLTGSNVPVTKQKFLSRYSGNMVQGKFEGPVVAVDERGMTFHAKFVDGSRTGEWATGSAPSSGKRGKERDAVVAIAESSGEKAAPPPAEGPASARSSISAQRPNDDISEQAETRGRGNDSLRSLTGPPSALRTDPAVETAPQHSTGSASTRPRLSKADVIRLADAEAGTQGYNIADYQRRPVAYTSENDTWSVSYNQKPVDGTAEIGKHFSVTVEDKTDKVSITPGR